MIAQVKYTGSRILNLARLLKVLVFGKDDIREVSEASNWGVDSCPISNTNAVYVSTASNGVSFVVGYINTHQKAAEGETRFYSTNSSGTFKFNVWLRADGTVLIGDSDTPASYTNFLTKFNELKTGFDQLKSDFNSHTHMYTPGALPPTPSAAPTVPSTASIDSSKATKIKTN